MVPGLVVGWFYGAGELWMNHEEVTRSENQSPPKLYERSAKTGVLSDLLSHNSDTRLRLKTYECSLHRKNRNAWKTMWNERSARTVNWHLLTKKRSSRTQNTNTSHLRSQYRKKTNPQKNEGSHLYLINVILMVFGLDFFVSATSVDKRKRSKHEFFHVRQSRWEGVVVGWWKWGRFFICELPTFGEGRFLIGALPYRWVFTVMCSSNLLYLFLAILMIVFWVFFSFNSVTRVVFEFLDCTRITPDVSVVATAPAIQCESSHYRRVLPVVWVLVILVVILAPICMLLSLIRAHQAKYVVMFVLSCQCCFWFVLRIRSH